MNQSSVLIVEDEAVVADDLAHKISALGYRVLDVVATGEAALELIQTRRPTIVLLDIKLGGQLDGIETANRLKDVCDIPFIFVTAHSDADTVKRASASGHSGFILKPFREHDIEIQLETALYKHRANKANVYLNLAEKAGSVGFFDYHFEQRRSVWTEGMAQLFGISLSDYDGTWQGWVKRVMPQDANNVREIIKATISEGRDHVTYEFRVILPDGTLRWLAARGQIFYGHNGRPLRMTGVNYDISDRKQAEQGLKKTEALLLRAQRGAQAGVWEIDLRTGGMIWSEPYYDVYGFSRSTEPSVTAWLSSIHPDDREQVLKLYRESIQETRNQNMEYRIIKPDGEIRWIHRQGQVEVDERGNAIRIQGISFDVTERKNRDDLFKAIALFPAQNPSPVLRISSAGILLYMNPASDELLRDLQLRCGDPVPSYLSEAVKNTLEAKEAQQTEISLGACHYLITIRPVIDEHYANLYWTDITERKRAEHALTQQTLQFKTLLNQAPLGVYLIDRHFKICEINPIARRFFGENVNVIDQDFDEVMHALWHKEYADEIVAIFRHTLVTGESYATPERIESRLDRGVTEYYEWRIDRIVLADGHFGVVCYFRDISTLVQAREALQQLNGQLEYRVIARTEELTQSQRQLRALAAELNLAEQRERKHVATELHDHLQQLLALGKIKLGQLKRISQSSSSCMHIIAEADKVLSDALSYTRTLVAELSPPALRNHGLLAGLKWLGEYMRRYQLNVTVQLPDEEIRIADDQALLLFQSVRELLINCAKYAETSEAWVNTNIDTDQLVIEVMDKGRGFESDRPANVSSDLSSNFGLFSIKERMHALGGSFQIVSSPGSGTIAALRLPLSAARASAEASGLSDTCQELSLPLFPL